MTLLLAQTNAVTFGTGDWVTLGCFVAAQTGTLGALVWRVVARIGNIEAKVDLLVATEIANLKDRVNRLENKLDDA